MSIMDLLQRRITSNPVLTAEHAAKLAVTTSVTHFDIHTDLEPLFAGTEARFMADVYSRLGWHIDTSIANGLRSVAGQLTVVPPADGIMTADFVSNLENELESMWQGEIMSDDAGHNKWNGPLHILRARVGVRERWHEYAALAAAENNRVYTPTSVHTIIGNPRRQEISLAYRANALIDALGIAGLLTDAAGRQAVNLGINYLTELNEISKKTGYTQEQLDCFKVEDPPEGASLKQVALAQSLKRRQELLGFIANFSSSVRTALAAYEHDMTKHAEQLETFYQRDLNRIPVMNFILDWIDRKTLVNDDEIHRFDQLPAAVQVDACEQAKQALGQTLERMRDRPSYVYSAYKNICMEAFKLLARVIDARTGRNEV